MDDLITSATIRVRGLHGPSVAFKRRWFAGTASNQVSRFMSRLLNLLLGLTMLLGGAVAHAGTVTYVYTDPQGTPLAEANASGTITATFDYQPYGSQALGSPKAGPGYTGHVNDPDTGFVYMQARYYDPVVGRFISVDPDPRGLASTGSFTRYGYADDNPPNNTDPNGRQTLPLSVYKTDWRDPRTRQFEAHLALNMVPGYGLYDCATSGCGKAGWSLSVVGAVLPVVGGVAKVASVVRIANAASEISAAGKEVSLLNKAVAARNELSASLAPLKGKAPATVTAGYNETTGEVAAAACGGGRCAESHVAEALGGNKADVKFTTAVRPRTGEEVPICERCEHEFGRSAFPTDAKFKSGGN